MAGGRRGKPPGARIARPSPQPRGLRARSSGAGAWADPANPVNMRHAQVVMAAMQALERGQVEVAKGGFRQVLDDNIEHPDALLGMGLVARLLRQHETAADLIRKAIGVNPKVAGYWSNLGNVLQDLDRWDEAVEAHAEAVRLRPDHPAIRQNLGSALNLVDRSYEALPHLREALRLDPESPDAAANYATVLSRVGEYATASRFFRQALAKAPEGAVANFNYGSHLIWTGRWAEGWPLYEWRFGAPSYRSSLRGLPVSTELPEALSGLRVLLYREQGIGDELRFATMVPDVIARGGEVTVEASPKLLTLFQRSFPGARVVPAPFRAAESGAERFDIIMPTGSLGRHLRMTADRFPRDRVVLAPDPERVAAMHRRLEALGPEPKVGIAWRSSARGRFRSQFYAAVADLEPILRVRGAIFVNLQYDDCAEELAEIRSRFGVTVHAVDDVDLFDDLDGSAALTAALDFVVSANTSVATIAGAVGVPAIEFHGRPVADGYLIEGHDPWFPSVRSIGKRIADPWGRTMRRIAEIVREYVRPADAG